jgi:hypothetical protein
VTLSNCWKLLNWTISSQQKNEFNKNLIKQMGIIYKLTSPSGKSYIGQTTRDF